MRNMSIASTYWCKTNKRLIEKKLIANIAVTKYCDTFDSSYVNFTFHISNTHNVVCACPVIVSLTDVTFRTLSFVSQVRAFVASIRFCFNSNTNSSRSN